MSCVPTAPSPATSQRQWHVIDADGHRPRPPRRRRPPRCCAASTSRSTRPHVDTGDFVIVINAEKVALAGDKKTTKLAYRHSGYPGGLTATPIGELLEKDARKVVEKAVWGMLPKNKLSRQIS